MHGLIDCQRFNSSLTVEKRESGPLMLNYLVKIFDKISQRIGWSVESLVEEISARKTRSEKKENI